MPWFTAQVTTPGDSPDRPPAGIVGDTLAYSRSPGPISPADPAVIAAALRERIYGSIACLSTLLIITAYPMVDPWVDAVDVLIASGGLWAASVLSEYLAHIGAHHHTPGGRELRHMFWVSGQIMGASVVPLLLLVLAGLTVLPPHAAVWTAVWILVGEMGLFALFAVRRTTLPWWGRVLLIVSLVALGLLVVLLKTAAH
jgi:hypothetical protein